MQVIRLLNSYLDSINLEYEQESIYFEIFRIKKSLKYFPRSVVIYNKYKNFLFFFNYYTLFPFILLWVIILNLIYSLICFLRYIFHAKFITKKIPPDNCYLFLSDYKFFSYIPESDLYYPEAIIEFPFHSSKKKYKSKLQVINLIEISNIAIMFCSLFIALLTPWFIIFTKKRHLILYTYSSYYWYLTYLTLNKSKFNSIWFSNHYDRWSSLVDSIQTVQFKVMVQHGQLEYIDHDTQKKYFPSFTKKYNSINRVYHINDNSKNYFLKIITCKNVVFNKVSPRLSLIDWPVNYKSKFKILVIGHENDYFFHELLINKLLYKDNYDIAYKLHPQQNEKIVLSNKVWLINKTEELPICDIVISYGSSLDIEINLLLPKVMIVNYGFKEKFITDDLIENLDNKINKILSEKNIK
jgi:hypothetical protein